MAASSVWRGAAGQARQGRAGVAGATTGSFVLRGAARLLRGAPHSAHRAPCSAGRRRGRGRRRKESGGSTVSFEEEATRSGEGRGRGVQYGRLEKGAAVSWAWRGAGWGGEGRVFLRRYEIARARLLWASSGFHAAVVAAAAPPPPQACLPLPGAPRATSSGSAGQPAARGGPHYGRARPHRHPALLGAGRRVQSQRAGEIFSGPGSGNKEKGEQGPPDRRQRASASPCGRQGTPAPPPPPIWTDDSANVRIPALVPGSSKPRALPAC